MSEPYTKEEAHAVAEVINGKAKEAPLAKLAKALVAAQRMMKPAQKDSENPHFKSKYADLASVMAACREALASNGLAVVQRISTAPNGITCKTLLIHESGESIEDALSLPVAKADAQGYGSAISYARRYSLAAMVGVVADDDDGEAAVGHGKAATQAPLGVEKLKKAVTKTDGPPVGENPVVGNRPHAPVMFRYGNAKGKTSFEVDDKSLDWYLDGVSKAVEDPAKAKFLAANTHELSLLQAEARFRAGVGQ